MTRGGKQIKLGDFGVARLLDINSKGDVEKAETAIGTINHMAPEVFDRTGYDASADIWSLGVVIYFMCSFDFPFYGSTERSIEQAAKRGVYETLPSHYSKKLTELVSSCLQVDPTRRPDI